CRPQRLADQIGRDPLTHRPAHDSAAGQIHDASQIQPALVGSNIGDVGDPGLVDSPAIDAPVEHVGSNRFVMGRVGRHAIRPLVHRAQVLPLEAVAHPFVADLNALLAQPSHDARPTVAALATRMQRRDLRVERRVGYRAITGRSRSPLAIAGTRHLKLTAHPGHMKPVAVLFDPGVLHRDSFAKYAAAFFTISRSSLALTSSRRSRAFSASSSETGRFTATAALVPPTDSPSRLRRTQFVMVDCGIPNRLAAVLPPVDCANLTASVLNSSVYRRF